VCTRGLRHPPASTSTPAFPLARLCVLKPGPSGRRLEDILGRPCAPALAEARRAPVWGRRDRRAGSQHRCPPSRKLAAMDQLAARHQVTPPGHARLPAQRRPLVRGPRSAYENAILVASLGGSRPRGWLRAARRHRPPNGRRSRGVNRRSAAARPAAHQMLGGPGSLALAASAPGALPAASRIGPPPPGGRGHHGDPARRARRPGPSRPGSWPRPAGLALCSVPLRVHRRRGCGGPGRTCSTSAAFVGHRAAPARGRLRPAGNWPAWRGLSQAASPWPGST